MTMRNTLSAAIVAVGLPIMAVDATAEGTPGGMMPRGTGEEAMGHRNMQANMCSETTCPCMMHGVMGSGMMRGDMGRGSGMAASGMTREGTKSGAGKLFGSTVTPQMNLSVDDVRGYLSLQLKQVNNKRLKIGDLKADDGIVTADVVTVDDSLVQRLKVDRHTGAIEYEN